MADVKIVYDNQELKVRDLGKIGLSLSSEIDDIFNLNTAKGVRVDNAVKRIVAAATQTDIVAVDHANEIGADLSRVAERKEASIYVDNIELFTGFALLNDTIKDGQGVNNFVFELQGKADSFFTELGQKNLSNFKTMGEILYDDTIIQGSWESSYDDGYPVVFAPVYYGEIENNDFSADNLRPHVKFRTITEAVVAELGWRLESTFLRSSYFENHLYLFGVGDDWSIRDQSEYQVDARASAGDIDSTTIAGGAIDCSFSDETTDIANTFDGTEYQAPETGVYRFLIRLWTDGGAYRAFMVNDNDTLLNELFEGENDVSIGLSISTKVRVKIFQNGSEIVSFLAGSRFRVIREGDVEVGGLIDVASCLHARPAKLFFDSITLKFCLAWYAHEPTRTLYCEPRFDYVIDGVKYDGFYAPPSTNNDALKYEDWSDKLDQASKTISINRAFGNSAIFKNKVEDHELYKSLAGYRKESIAFMAAKVIFGEYGKKSRTFEDPYFTDLFTIAANEFDDLTFMPIILDSEYDPAEDPVNAPVIPAATYRSEPKYGFYHGLMNFETWNYNGGAQKQRPVVNQRIPDNSQDYTFKFNASFHDFKDSINSNLPSIPGHLSIFYQQLFAMLKNAQVINGDVDLSLDDFASLDHRILKQLDINGTRALYLLLKVSGFDPVNLKKAKCVFLKYGTFHQAVSILSNRQTSNVSF